MTSGLPSILPTEAPADVSLGDILRDAAPNAEVAPPTFSLPQPFGQRDLVFRLDPARTTPLHIETLVVKETYGFFGNNLYQLLNALILARALGSKRLFMVQPNGVALRLPLRAGGAFVFPWPPGELRGSTLRGHFYAPRGFEDVIRATPTAAIEALVSEVVRPGFRDVWAEGPAGIEDQMVLHFRAGDIFLTDASHSFYAQPPAAFYRLAAREIHRRFGIRKAMLVFQDESNPAVALVRAQLAEDGFAVSLQSADTATDLRTLVAARHLVVSNSTFCEAAALLAPDLKSYWTFRRFFAGGPGVEGFAQGRVGEVLRAQGTRTFIVDDARGAYVDPAGWNASATQVEQVKTYPIEHLHPAEQR